jgi:hypothetical protein
MPGVGYVTAVDPKEVVDLTAGTEKARPTAIGIPQRPGAAHR